jgi:hypothetical protein
LVGITEQELENCTQTLITLLDNFFYKQFMMIKPETLVADQEAYLNKEREILHSRQLGSYLGPMN